MKIVVLNGSPKGELSVTLQYVRFAARKLPDHTFQTFHVAQTIRKLEKDEKAFGEIMEAVKKADAVWWSFPLYYLIVCSQYKRFIELIFERGQQAAFAEKYTLSLSTSVHFFDNTAHNYIQAICDDLQMKYLGAYSAAMYDLMRKSERKRWVSFAQNFVHSAVRQVPTARVYPPLAASGFTYQAGSPAAGVDAAGKRILIMKDGQHPTGNIDAMVQSFAANFRGTVETINLMDIDIKGGCLGCCKCGLDNKCDYEGKDGYIDFYNGTVKQADIVVFAGAIHDRYLSSRWKMYFDRSFFNTHMPTLSGKQIAFLISGPLGQIPNLRQILEAYSESQKANLVGIVTDETADARQIDQLLAELAGALDRAFAAGFAPPITFFGVGGRKIFRDEVYGMLRFTFQADYRYYKKHGYFDFPQKNYKIRRLNMIMMLLTKFPPFRKKFLKILKEQMVKPIKSIAENR
ncbi:MAG: NAD(P)H-dependent oxidoreductase [Deltaproteobacteria bacterium]